jgi:hypothetical protein
MVSFHPSFQTFSTRIHAYLGYIPSQSIFSAAGFSLGVHFEFMLGIRDRIIIRAEIEQERPPRSNGTETLRKALTFKGFGEWKFHYGMSFQFDMLIMIYNRTSTVAISFWLI